MFCISLLKVLDRVPDTLRSDAQIITGSIFFALAKVYEEEVAGLDGPACTYFAEIVEERTKPDNTR